MNSSSTAALEVVVVLDLVSQFRDVVLVRCIFSSREPQGVRILEWGVYGEGMEMESSVYEQPGTKVDGILSQQGGFQVSRRETKGGKKKWEKQQKQGDCTVITLFVKSMYIVNAFNCLNDCQSIYVCLIIVGYECS